MIKELAIIIPVSALGAGLVMLVYLLVDTNSMVAMIGG